MRPIEVGDWVECIRPDRCGLFKLGGQYLCIGVDTGGFCSIHGPGASCLQTGIHISGKDPTPFGGTAWSACAFVPIFPRLCEEVAETEEPVDVTIPA